MNPMAGLILILTFTTHVVAADNALTVKPGDLCVVLGKNATSVERRAAQLFVAEVRRRTGIEVFIDGTALTKHSLVVGTADSSAIVRDYAERQTAVGKLKTDGFHLMTTPDADGRIYAVGQSPSGVVAGLGKLLRLSRYTRGAMEIPTLTLSDNPQMQVRGMYFATHFNNFYHVAPPNEVDRVVEELALWGANQLVVWFDMHHFKSFQDPAAQKHLARLKHFAETAHGVGVKFGLTFLANEGYAASPKHLRATRDRGVATYGVELCPSKPEGLALIGKWQAEVLDAFPRVDLVWSWPYDQGGCACEQCRPWGGNGFLRASGQLAKLYRERFPEGELWLSTWWFDLHQKWGDFDGLFRYIRGERPTWFNGLISGRASPYTRLFQRPQPERYPVAWFPEISMHQMSPWGGFGANPLPSYCGERAKELRGRIVGGWPYSEGIYEDLNKFFWVQFFWNPERPTDAILAEYASYYLGPDSVDRAVRLFHLLEKTHARRNWRVRNLAEGDETWSLAQAIDARRPEWAKTSWRWRILYVRTAIDRILKDKGYMTPEARAALEPLCDEIVSIYHAERTNIRPPDFPPPPDPRNLAYGRPAAASSTLPGYEGSVRMLVDGIRAQDDPLNFWAHDPAKEGSAWVVIDLGKITTIKEVRLQFRCIHGVYWFVPKSIGFEASEDGENFEAVGSSNDVPAEGANYSPRFWVYRIDKKGRHLRVNLGSSQHVGDQYAGTLELTEIEAFGGE